MPYVDQETQVSLDNGDRLPETIGELCYVFSQSISDFMRTRPVKNFDTLSDVIKALECTKLDFFNRFVQPYENSKRSLNGDVYRW